MRVSSEQLIPAILVVLLAPATGITSAQAHGPSETQLEQSSGAGTRTNKDIPNHVVFLTPADGAVVHPGETLHVEVSVAPGSPVLGMFLIGPLGISEQIREEPPYSFTLTIPDEELSGSERLIGRHGITAFGGIKGQNGTILGTISVDVEESDMPTKLVEVSNGSANGAPGFRFFGVGEEDWLRIHGTFPNSHHINLTGSTHLTMVSGNTKVVSVDDGSVMSIGPGTTAITAAYSLGDQTMRITIPVSVTVSLSGLVVAPLFLDFGNQQAGTASAPREVTLSNHSDEPITIYEFVVRATVRETDDCTTAPLPPDGTCTISITFMPFQPGRTQGVIYISNSFSQLSLPILGNGI